jgi:hypothetical protein
MMRKALWLIGAALLAAAATSSVALAAVNVKALPTATFNGPSVTVTGGEFSGLGSIEAKARLEVRGVATYQCENPSGKVVPGQNPVEAAPGASPEVGLGNSTHNGRGTITSITAEVKPPEKEPTAKQVACGGTGNEKWTVTRTGLRATSAELVIKQEGKVVFCRIYTLGGSPTGAAC